MKGEGDVRLSHTCFHTRTHTREFSTVTMADFRSGQSDIIIERYVCFYGNNTYTTRYAVVTTSSHPCDLNNNNTKIIASVIIHRIVYAIRQTETIKRIRSIATQIEVKKKKNSTKKKKRTANKFFITLSPLKPPPSRDSALPFQSF